MSAALLPAARWIDVLRGRASLVGARVSPHAKRGVVSPVEARVHLGVAYDDLATAERDYLARRTLRGDAGVVARALIARALAPASDAPRPARPWIVSAPIDNLSIDEALVEIFAAPRGARARMIHFVHPHALNLAAFDTSLARQLARADRVLPDGIGIRLAARLLGLALRANLNGTDLLPRICREASATGVPLVLVGAGPGVAAECARRLEREHPGLRVVSVSDGYLDDARSRALGREIAAFGRCLVLVGMGTPRQESWAWRYLAGANAATVVTVGGLFDFYSGRVGRAPRAWRELGIEWLYRGLKEPRRLGLRYAVGNPAFLMLAFGQRLGRRTMRGA